MESNIIQDSKESTNLSLENLSLDDKSKKKKCKFVPIRDNQKPCLNDMSTDYGFCSKHKNSVQGRNAEREHILKKASIVSDDVKKSKKTTSNKKEPIEITTPSKDEKKHKKKDVLKTYIKPNYWGNYEHPDLHIVFNPSNTTAIGIQQLDGKVTPLKSKDIDICEKRGWKYLLHPSIKNTLKSEDVSVSSGEEDDTNDMDDDKYSEEDDKKSSTDNEEVVDEIENDENQEDVDEDDEEEYEEEEDEEVNDEDEE